MKKETYSTMNEFEIETLRDYLGLIQQYTADFQDSIELIYFLFRGQQTESPLLPTIRRLQPKGEMLEIERKLFDEFKRANPLLIEHHQPLDDWDYLTLGQHFGLPTRLLDWSNNALTAMWFATKGTSLESDHVIVWIIIANEKDFVSPADEDSVFTSSSSKFFNPRLIKQRINSQSGVFTIFSSDDLLQGNPLNENIYYKDKMIEVKIPHRHIRNIQAELNTLGINAFSIFPELEGLCSHLQWRYFER